MKNLKLLLMIFFIGVLAFIYILFTSKSNNQLNGLPGSKKSYLKDFIKNTNSRLQNSTFNRNFRQGNFPESDNEFEQAERGWLFYINGYIEEGISILENAIQSESTNLDAIMHLVSIYDEIGNKGKLNQFISSVINANPQDNNLCVNMARYFVEKDSPEFDVAIQVIKLGILQNPDDPEIYQFAGSLYEQQGSYNEAISHYKKAIEIVDFDPLTYFRIGNSYLKFGDKASAIDWFSIATTLSEEYKPIVEKLLFHES